MKVNMKEYREQQKRKKLAAKQKVEEKPTPWSTDRIDMEMGSIIVKAPITINKDRLLLLDRICDILEQPLASYLAQALYDKLDSDLHSPEFIGKAFCDGWLPLWDMYKEEAPDSRLLRYSTRK